MARLQDYPNVTPTSSDKFLVVQSTGQGLVAHTSKMNSTDPTGTGKLSLNRASGSEGNYSVAIGYGNTASGNVSHAENRATTASGDYSHAEGYSTTASGTGCHSEGYSTTASGSASHSEGRNTTGSGDYSHAEGFGTIANHKSQHVFGEYNTADASTATAGNRGNYVEIVGKGSNDSNRSNARTLDWNGNETLSGDLTYNGNVSLTRLLNQYYFKTGSPIVISGLSRYETFIVMGFAQSIGTVVIMVTISAGTLDNVINMKTGTAFSNTHLTFTYSSSSNSLTIASDNANESRLTVIRG